VIPKYLTLEQLDILIYHTILLIHLVLTVVVLNLYIAIYYLVMPFGLVIHL